MQHLLLLSYAAGETEGRGQDAVANRIDDFQVGVVQERSQSYHNYMVEAIKLVEHMLGTSIAAWDRGAYDTQGEPRDPLAPPQPLTVQAPMVAPANVEGMVARITNGICTWCLGDAGPDHPDPCDRPALGDVRW